MEPILCDQPFQFTYWINNPLSDNGWSETWHLIDIERPKALAAAEEILEARSWILGSNLYIELAELRRLDLPRRSFFFPQDPLFPVPQWDIAHDDFNGIRIRFQTAKGKYCNHVIRGLERGEMRASAWTRTGATVLNKPTAKPADATLASKEELLRYFFWLLKKHTCYLKKVGDFYSLVKWEFLGDNGTKSLPPARAVQRVSAEWAYWFYAAPFSYCGTVCGVQRSCRAVACRPYKDGPNMPIRFYFAAPGAKLFPWDTIFWGTYRDKDIPNGGNPGEIKGPQYTVAVPSGKWQYSWGFSYGSAPGLVPTGTPDDFLGLGIKPWADFDDPNPHAGALCDMPIFGFQVQDDNGTTVIVANAMTLGFENSDFIVTEVSPGRGNVKLRNPGTLTGSGIADYVTRWTSTTNISTGTATDDTITFGLRKRFSSLFATYNALVTPEYFVDVGDAMTVALETSTPDFHIGGITNGTNGRLLFLWNVSEEDFFLDHLSPGAVAANRLFTPTEDDVRLMPGSGAILQWLSPSGPWLVMVVTEASLTNSGIVNTEAQVLGAGEKMIERVTVGRVLPAPFVFGTTHAGIWNESATNAITMTKNSAFGPASSLVATTFRSIGIFINDSFTDPYIQAVGAGIPCTVSFNVTFGYLDSTFGFACAGQVGVTETFLTSDGYEIQTRGGIVTQKNLVGGGGFSADQLALIVAIAQSN